MIRINLLGVPRQKKGKRGGIAATSMPGDGPNIVVLLVLGAVLGGGAGFYQYWSANKEATRLDAETETQKREQTRLSGIKTKHDLAKLEEEALNKRQNAINDLQSKRVGPVTLLDTVGDTINNTDAVWLNNMTENGSKISIEGTALSTQAVANLMTNLKNSGEFKTVEIKQTAQDTRSKDIQAFNFSLECERKPKS